MIGVLVTGIGFLFALAFGTTSLSTNFQTPRPIRWNEYFFPSFGFWKFCNVAPTVPFNGGSIPTFSSNCM